MALKSLLYLILFGIGVFYTFKRPYYGVMLFILMNFIRPDKVTYEQLTGLHLPLVISVLLFVLFLLRLQETRKLENEKPLFFFFILFVCSAYISSITAIVSTSVSLKYSNVFFKIFIFCFISAKLLKDKKDFNMFLKITTIGVSFIALWGFQQHFRGNIRLEEVGGRGLNESNGIAILFVQMAPMYFSMFFLPSGNTVLKKWLTRIFGLFMAIIIVADIVFTQSRAAFLGLIVTVIIYLIRKRQVKYIIAFALAGGLFFYTATRTEGYLDRIKISEMEKDKGSDRLAIWHAGWRVFLEFPITGIGQENFRYIANYFISTKTNRSIERNFDAHNIFIHFMACGGIVQLSSFLFMILFFYINTFRAIRIYSTHSDNDPVMLENVIAIEAGFSGLIVGTCFHTLSIAESLYWWLWLPAAAVSISMQKASENNVYKNK